MVRRQNPFLCLGIVAILGSLALSAVAGLVSCALWGKENSVAVASVVAALISIGSSAAGAIASFLVTPPKGSAGVDHGDDKP